MITCGLCRSLVLLQHYARHLDACPGRSRIAEIAHALRANVDRRKRDMSVRPSMASASGDVSGAVSELVRALMDELDVQLYQELPYAQELAELVRSPGHVFNEATAQGRRLGYCAVCSGSRHTHRDPARSAARIREIEADHAYRTAWNVRSKMLKRRLEALLYVLSDDNNPNPPSHASQAW